jgi:hypothetical protein
MSYTVAVMAVTPTSFRAVIDLWGTIAAFALDIGEDYENARQWRLNDSIPGRAYTAIVRAASARDLPVTHELLCGFAEAKHRQRTTGAA